MPKLEAEIADNQIQHALDMERADEREAAIRRQMEEEANSHKAEKARLSQQIKGQEQTILTITEDMKALSADLEGEIAGLNRHLEIAQKQATPTPSEQGHHAGCSMQDCLSCTRTRLPPASLSHLAYWLSVART